ncbi:MAG: dihydrodipicolinate reductase C-terminal domain-containing protein [Bacillota bacterium]|nr:dihydrodipicolinate reductase C-terminal domain-containing protein [Bacillota bacterium]
MIKVFVTGASGNVGATIVRFIQDKPEFTLAGGYCLEAGQDLGLLAGIGELGIMSAPELDAGLEAAAPDVVIDFSVTPVLKQHLEIYLRHGLNVVVGTTGLTDDELAPFAAQVKAKGLRWAAISNYGLGISLVSEFIKSVRKYYPYVSIIDQHTHNMANAPSGTAASLAQAASGPMGEVKAAEVYPGVLGATIAGVPVFAQRLPFPGPYSGHVVTLARADEIIKVEVMDFTSDIYMDGVFLTAAKLAQLPAGSFVASLAEVMEA